MYIRYISLIAFLITNSAHAAEQNCLPYYKENYHITDQNNLIFSKKDGIMRVSKHDEKQSYKNKQGAIIETNFTLANLTDFQVPWDLNTIIAQVQFSRNLPLTREKKYSLVEGLDYRRAVDENDILLVYSSMLAEFEKELKYISDGKQLISFGREDTCKILRTEFNHEIQKGIIAIPNGSKISKYKKCLYTGLLVYYGLGNFNELYSEKYHKIESDSYSFRWPLVTELRVLYDEKIYKGMSLSQVEALIKQLPCKQ
ncbi:hypothetical protein GR183_16435 [Stappia sp. GBMRC 2046]|uniref:Uncharacterized protein n=1 Tax=Stappia sediminis TaxID=2692190 RepID=A0A7X3LWP3_9HYPH|nr:hypothetical protein [Stappia sediminis]MXN66504.1 hypothetical protein [Stappia sediminis]